MDERRAQRATDEGVSLIEMMVAILVLGVAMAALAQLLVGSLRATREAQDTSVVTGAITEITEELLSLEWSEAALYDGEIATADTRWSDRLDSTGIFDGHPLITRPGPGDPTFRDQEVPYPSQSMTRDGIAYTFDVYPIWVDRSQVPDGVDDTKRFVVVATWEDPVRGSQELRMAAERAPSQEEAGSTASGVRFMSTWASPAPVSADGSGFLVEPVEIVARTNRALVGAVHAELTWEEPVFDGDGNVTGQQTATAEISLTPTVLGPDGGHVGFEGTFHGRTGNDASGTPFRFLNGPVQVVLTGEPAGGGDDVQTTLFFNVRNSPFGPQDDGEDGDDEGSDVDPPTYGGTPTLSIVSPFPEACANQSNSGAVLQDIVVTVTVTNVQPPTGDAGDPGYVPPDGRGQVTYRNWKKNASAGDDNVAHQGSASLHFKSGSVSLSTWEATFPVEAGFELEPEGNIEYQAFFERDSDEETDTEVSSMYTVTKTNEASKC